MIPKHLGLIFLVTFFLGLADVSTGQKEPLVTAPAGTFRGKVLTSPSGVRYASYRGIPYALPPTGERRFAKPDPQPVIQGTYDASKFGPICAQNTNGAAVGQEDCLFLNVFTPLQVKKTRASNRRKSVLVHIHGGGLILGSSNMFLPGDLVTKANIVVVTMNYRLGWLGFLHGNSSSLPGNQGFWDQLLALRWVKDNIRAFGGNPYDVTLSGDSSGSLSASLLSISPLGSKLFKKGIFLSGNVAGFPSTPQTSNTLLEILSQQLGCGVEPVTGNEEAVITCLKQQPADKFFIKFSIVLTVQFITSGNDILPRNLSELVEDSQYLEKIGFYDRDYILSATKEDGYLLVNSKFGFLNTSTFESSVRDFDKTFLVTECFARLLITEFLKLYNDLEKSLSQIITDDFFLRPHTMFLKYFYTSRRPSHCKRSNKAYLMSFDHSLDYFPNQFMVHGFDLPYLFDMHPREIAENYLLFPVNGNFSEADFRLKSDFIYLMGTFIKYGIPGTIYNRKTSIEWPPFDENKKSYLSFSLHPEVKEDILSSRRYIWDTLFFQWLQQCQVRG